MLIFGGVVAGILTTVAGLGGGMVLVLCLSLVWGAPTALAVTAPALLLGNIHRAWLFRQAVDRPVVLRFAAGAVPAAIFGGVVAARVPPLALQGAMLFITTFAIARAMGWVRFAPSPAALVPAGAMVGLIAATSGGGAVLAAPVLMAAGMAGEAYVATVALASVALHSGRIVGYGAAGLIDAQTLERSLVLGVAILVGNIIGQRLRKSVPARAGRAIEVAGLSACTVLAVAGLA